MIQRSKPTTAWLLATIAASLLGFDACQMAFATRPFDAFGLLMGGISFAAGAALAVPAEAWWRD